MIDKVLIENFKSHRRTEIELGRLTLLVGPNSSGKSSVLEAIDLLCQLTQRHHSEVFSGQNDLESLFRKLATGAMTVRVEGLFGVKDKHSFFQCSVERESSHPRDTKAPKLEWRLDEAGQGSLKYQDIPDHIRNVLGFLKLMRLDARKLSQPRYSDQQPAEMTEDGEGLANVIADMLLAADGSFDKVVTALRAVVPTVERVKVKRTEVRQRKAGSDEVRTLLGDGLLFDFVGARDIPAYLVSEGTLIALGILANTRGGPLILIDDIEHALHPRAQVELVDNLKAVLETQPQLRIIATTHSPYLLDAVDAKDVWVLATGKDGSTACDCLKNHPNARKALEVLTPGEFYSSEDPKWVTEQPDG